MGVVNADTHSIPPPAGVSPPPLTGSLVEAPETSVFSDCPARIRPAFGALGCDDLRAAEVERRLPSKYTELPADRISSGLRGQRTGTWLRTVQMLKQSRLLAKVNNGGVRRLQDSATKRLPVFTAT
jgi:hypothetical protein